jgi:hypothetical protein
LKLGLRAGGGVRLVGRRRPAELDRIWRLNVPGKLIYSKNTIRRGPAEFTKEQQERFVANS